MSAYSNHGSGSAPHYAPRAISWLSMTVAFAIAFVATGKLHAFTVDWAIAQLAEPGTWTAYFASGVWFLVVAVLTFTLTNLAVMKAIMLGSFGLSVLFARIAR